MTQPFRTNKGGRIDRTRTLRFQFDGRRYSGHPGDSLASALLANGVRVTGRSFKYHRPRGLMAAGVEEANTLVQLEEGARTAPNSRATQVELYDKLQSWPVNCWPSARFDLGSILQWFKRFMPAGFYYKTFIAPNWHCYEWIVRKGAGLGLSPKLKDPDVYDKGHAAADVVIVGAGPSGIAAAVEAARAGATVIVLDEKSEPGGSLLYELEGIEGMPAQDWLSAHLDELRANPKVRLLTRSTAFGYYDHNHILANEIMPHGRNGVRERLWKIRAGEVVLATGSIERPMVFPNNDRPGVMLAGAARQYLNRFGALPGKRVVLATNNDSVYALAQELLEARVTIAVVLDTRDVSANPVVARAIALGLSIKGGVAPTNVFGSKGLHAVEFHSITVEGVAVAGSGHTVPADALLVSGGWNPTVHLFSQSGGELRFDAGQQAFVPRRFAQPGRVVGAASGLADRERAVAAARRAGAAAASHAILEAPEGAETVQKPPPWTVDVRSLGRTAAYSWVDFASDSTEGDLRLAAQENFVSVEHFKRYTTTGMMTDQGKTSNVNAIGILGGVLAKAPDQVGTTRFRPPYTPITFGSIAGRNVGDFYKPLLRLPMHDAHLALGAKLEDYGAWLRPAFYPRAGETEKQSIDREVNGVRSGVGILEYSPLGKIIVHGPDAAEFLQRLYVNNIKTLKVGQCRYGLMCGEDGIVKDDGVLTRWGEQSFLVGSTSGMADKIADWLDEWLQCEWTDLDVIIEPVTTQWATVMVAGPRARDLLSNLATGIDLAPESFPHMSGREGVFGSVPLRAVRVSFTGELGFELSVPWNIGLALWQALLEAGRELGVLPFGIESLMVMRVEKGFLHVGSDSDGMTFPQDLGFDEIIAKKKEDFAGRRSLMTPDGLRNNRRQLVGLASLDGKTPMPIGAHVVGSYFTRAPAQSQGWVTSSIVSPTLSRPVALALVEGGRRRIGETVKLFDAGRIIDARIVEAAAYDPQGERLRL